MLFIGCGFFYIFRLPTRLFAPHHEATSQQPRGRGRGCGAVSHGGAADGAEDRWKDYESAAAEWAGWQSTDAQQRGEGRTDMPTTFV